MLSLLVNYFANILFISMRKMVYFLLLGNPLAPHADVRMSYVYVHWLLTVLLAELVGKL